MKRILTVALMTVVMAGLGSTAAFAEPPPAPGLPGQVPGPNSSEASSPGDGSNYGQCQSQLVAPLPGDANAARNLNPALNTAGQTFTADCVLP